MEKEGEEESKKTLFFRHLGGRVIVLGAGELVKSLPFLSVKKEEKGNYYP